VEDFEGTGKSSDAWKWAIGLVAVVFVVAIIFFVYLCKISKLLCFKNSDK